MDEKKGAFFIYMNLETLRLEPDDVRWAVEVFENRFGQRPLALGLHKGCAPQIKAAAEEMGIMVHHPPGMLAQEIWLNPSESFVTRSSAIGSLQLQIDEWRNRIQPRPLVPLGRPPIELPRQELLELRGRGLGAREIAKRLQQQGLEVSHMTVHRVIRKMNGGKK